MFWLGLFLLAFLVLNGYLHLGVQGKEGELRPDRSFGVLTLFLALFGLVGHLLSASERFLFAPDIGVMMYEGSDLQRAGLYLLLIGVVFFGALMPETARQFVQRGAEVRGRRLVLLLVLAAAVSAFSCFGVRVLNPSDLTALQIQAYDLFFPPLVIWTGSCILLALAWCLRVPARFYPAVPVVWIVSFWLCGELRARPYDDGWTIWIWRTASLVVVAAFAAYVARGKLAADADTGTEETPRLDPASEAQRERRRKGAAVGLTALMLSFFVVYLLTSSALLQVKLRTLVLGYVAFWLVLAEFEDPRASVVTRFLGIVESAWKKRSSAPEENPPEDAQDGGKGLLGILKWPSLGKTVGALLGALVLAFALLVVNEIPNRHKTMVMPFRDLAGYGSTELDEGIAEYVTYQLALYDQGLRQVSIPLSGPAPRRSSSGFTLGSATDPGSSFTTSNNLKVGDFEIPLQVILNPVLEPIRRFLDTRVIRGSVHIDERRYSLIATSSRGESWRVESERKPAEDSERDQETNKLKFRNETLYGKLRELAGQLAFEIYANSASATGPASGMTSSWEAFHSFWTGFTILRNLEESPSGEDAAQEANLRREAIHAIERAIAIDRSFALASYHLALAKLSQVKTVDESKESIALLRETVEDVPEFIPAYNALAYTLVRWNGDKGEAESLLKRVLLSWSGDPVSRALAYHGLALLELDSDGLLAVAEGFQEAADSEEPEVDRQRELEENTRAFYYARKAESLYAATTANDPQILRRRAAVLGDLGRLLERRAGELVAVPADRWSCRGEMLLFSLPAQELDKDQAMPRPQGWTLMTASGSSVVVDRAELEKAFARRGLSHLDFLADPKPTGRRGEAWQLETSHGSFFLLVEGRRLNVYGKVLRRSPYSHAARRFLRRTIALEPHDRTNLCQLAASNHLVGRSTAMDHLESDTKMHLAIAHRYAVHYPGSGQKIDREAVPAFFFELALEEYRALLERSPQNSGVREEACNVLSVAILRSTLGVRASRWEPAFSCPLEEVEAAPAADLSFLEPSTLNERTWLELAGQAVRSARQGDFEPAEALLGPLRTLARGYELLEAATHTVVGRLRELQGENEGAAESYKEALRRFQRLGDGKGQIRAPSGGIGGELRAYGDLVRVYATLSREGPAEDRPRYTGQAEEYYRQVADAQGSDSRVAAAASHEMAAMFEARGELGPAEDYARRAVVAGERLGNPEVLADYLDEYARKLENAGKLDDAEAVYQRAFEIRSSSLEPEDVRIASSFGHLGRIACLRGDDAATASYQQRAYAMLRRFGAAHALALARAAEALGRSSLRQGRWEQAEGPLAEALGVVEEEDLGEPGLRLEHVFLVAGRAALREAKEADYDPQSRRAYGSAGARALWDAAEESLRSLLPLQPPLRAEAVLEDLRQATRCGRRPEDVKALLSAYVAERRDRLRALGYEPQDDDWTSALESFRKKAALPKVTDPDAGLLDSRTDTALAELARLEGLRRSAGGDFDVLALAPESGQAETWSRFFQKKVAEVSRSRPFLGIEPKVPRIYVDLREGGVADVGSSPPGALWLVGGPETLRDAFFAPEGVLECQVKEKVLRCRLEEGTRAHVPGPPEQLEAALDQLEEDGMSLARALARIGLGQDGWLAHGDARGTDPMWLIAGTE